MRQYHSLKSRYPFVLGVAEVGQLLYISSYNVSRLSSFCRSRTSIPLDHRESLLLPPQHPLGFPRVDKRGVPSDDSTDLYPFLHGSILGAQ